MIVPTFPGTATEDDIVQHVQVMQHQLEYLTAERLSGAMQRVCAPCISADASTSTAAVATRDSAAATDEVAMVSASCGTGDDGDVAEEAGSMGSDSSIGSDGWEVLDVEA